MAYSWHAETDPAADLTAVPEISNAIRKRPGAAMLARVLKDYVYREVATLPGPGRYAILALLDMTDWHLVSLNLLCADEAPRSISAGTSPAPGQSTSRCSRPTINPT